MVDAHRGSTLRLHRIVCAFLLGRELDFTFGLLRLLHQRPDGVKHHPELRIVFVLRSCKLFCKIGMRREQPAQPYKCPHDLNVDFNGPFTVQDA